MTRRAAPPPGRGYVDVIMWDPYNANRGNWRSFSAIATKFYKALDDGMLDKVDPSAKSLRRGLGEFGSMPDARRPAWLRALPSDPPGPRRRRRRRPRGRAPRGGR